MWYAVPIALLCMSMLDEDEAGQRPRRGQNPVEHRRTFVRSSVHPSVCPSVHLSPPPSPQRGPSLSQVLLGPSQALEDQIQALGGQS